jgi:tetratricopeptide (TPR) repeat protein
VSTILDHGPDLTRSRGVAERAFEDTPEPLRVSASPREIGGVQQALVSVVGIFAILLAATTTPAAAQVPAASRVLVMPFAASVDAASPGSAGRSLWLGQAVALLITDDLRSRGVPAVSREECVRAFDRLQLPMSSTLTRATMVRVGELLGASEIVFGDVRLGARLSVRARMIRLDAGALEPDVARDGSLDEIFDVSHRVGGVLAAGLGQPAADDRGPDSHLPLDVFENYMKGLLAATPAAAQRFLESALKQAPRDARVLAALWAVYTGQGAHEKALGVASAVPKDSPISRQARFSAVLSLIDLGRLQGAFHELNTLYTERPAAALSNALGVVQVRRGPTPGVAPPAFYFTRAAGEDPGNPDYLFNLGYASALAHDAEAALLWLREDVRYEARNGDAHLVMSSVLAGAGRLVGAQRELDLARLLGARAAGSAPAPIEKIATGLERLRTDLDPAPADRLAAAARAPADRDQQAAAAFELDRGRRLVAARNDREAAGALGRAIYLAPYEDEPHLLLGRIYQRAGRVQDAVEEFTVALWCRDTAPAHVALGAALLDAGDKDGARREAERALVLDHDSPDAKALLKRAGGGVLRSVQSHGRSGRA